MKLLLRPDAYRATTDTGLHFLTPHGPVTFTGASIARWVERLAPRLDGRFTLAELTAGLDAQRGAMVERVVTALVDSGVVREVEDGESATAPATGGAGPPADTGFVSYFRSRAQRAVDDYYSGVTLVLGTRGLLGPIADACAASGIREIRTAVSDGAAPGRCRLPAAAPAEEADRDIADLVADSAVVLYTTASPDPYCIRLLCELCAGTGKILGQLFLRGHAAVHGPVDRVRPGEDAWRSAWHRMAAVPWTRAPEGSPLAPDRASTPIVAAQFAHRVFRTATGVESPPATRLLASVDLGTLQSRRHGFHGHPFGREATCRSEEGFLADIAAFETGAPLDPETMSRRSAELLDGRAGVFAEITERDLPQFPLSLSRMTVSDPVGLCAGAAPPTVGAGADLTSARHCAAMRAYAVYGALMLDPRRLRDAHGRGLRGDPHALLAELRDGQRSGFAWGYRLTDRRACLVPAHDVFPALDGSSTGPPPVGTAAGYTWHHAVESALVAHCRDIVTRAADGAEDRFPRLDLDRVALDGPGEQYRAMLRAVGWPLEVRDLTEVLGVPCHVLRFGEAGTEWGAGASTAEALREAMARALLQYQTGGQGDGAALPCGGRAPEVRDRPGSRKRLGVRALADALRRSGREPVLVPLDHDPEVARRMPYLVRVVDDG